MKALLETTIAKMKGFNSVSQPWVWVGLDGCVDEIIHVVDKRQNEHTYSAIPEISHFRDRVTGAIGKSTNFELVVKQIKIGGNGPIMANALSEIGAQVHYVGSLGYPGLHPVFHDFYKKNDAVSIADVAHTDALEFRDGKLMMCKTIAMNEITWKNIEERVGIEKLTTDMNNSQMIALVNWTMTASMTVIFRELLVHVFPKLTAPRKIVFVDLADPEKRMKKDLKDFLDVLSLCQTHCDVILGLNEKEGLRVAEILGIPLVANTPADTLAAAKEIQKIMGIHTVMIHPILYAVAVGETEAVCVDGPPLSRVTLTTGGGDHLNAGFCFGLLNGLSLEESLLLGVAHAGLYIQDGKSPTLSDLLTFMHSWKNRL